VKTTIAACGIAPSGVIDWGSRCYHEHLQVFNGFGELPNIRRRACLVIFIGWLLIGIASFAIGCG
jgi:hypothetical protein